MLKKLLIAVFILLVLFGGFIFFSRSKPVSLLPADERAGQKEQLFAKNESLLYDMKLGRITLGKAELDFQAGGKLGTKDVYLFTFNTRSVKINDLEKIYADPQTLLPLRVERQIRMWPLNEEIIEEYDQKNFRLKIKKFSRKQAEEAIIQKEGPIQNAILLPYYVRSISDLRVGWKKNFTLPTQEFEVELVSLKKIKTVAGEFNAYYFKSRPPKFEIWISADERRLPLRIKGMGKLGYILELKEYNSL